MFSKAAKTVGAKVKKRDLLYGLIGQSSFGTHNQTANMFFYTLARSEFIFDQLVYTASIVSAKHGLCQVPDISGKFDSGSSSIVLDISTTPRSVPEGQARRRLSEEYFIDQGDVHVIPMLEKLRLQRFRGLNFSAASIVSDTFKDKTKRKLSGAVTFLEYAWFDMGGSFCSNLFERDIVPNTVTALKFEDVSCIPDLFTNTSFSRAVSQSDNVVTITTTDFSDSECSIEANSPSITSMPLMQCQGSFLLLNYSTGSVMPSPKVFAQKGPLQSQYGYVAFFDNQADCLAGDTGEYIQYYQFHKCSRFKSDLNFSFPNFTFSGIPPTANSWEFASCNVSVVNGVNVFTMNFFRDQICEDMIASKAKVLSPLTDCSIPGPLAIQCANSQLEAVELQNFYYGGPGTTDDIQKSMNSANSHSNMNSYYGGHSYYSDSKPTEGESKIPDSSTEGESNVPDSSTKGESTIPDSSVFGSKGVSGMPDISRKSGSSDKQKSIKPEIQLPEVDSNGNTLPGEPCPYHFSAKKDFDYYIKKDNTNMLHLEFDVKVSLETIFTVSFSSLASI